MLSKNRITEAGARTPKAGWRSESPKYTYSPAKELTPTQGRPELAVPRRPVKQLPVPFLVYTGFPSVLPASSSE